MENIGVNESVISWMVFWITYWSLGGWLTYKMQCDKTRKIEKLNKVVFTLFYNMVWTFFASVLLSQLPLRMMTDSHIIIKIIMTYIITDIWFYHIHIMMHQKQLYWTHKLHHEFPQPYALTALYCSYYEAIFLNTFAAGLPVVVLQLSPICAYLWFFISAADSVLSHSGLNIPYIIDDYHDLHHKHFQYNYGISHLFDNIYNTRYINSMDKTENEKLELKEFSNLGNFKINGLEDIKLEGLKSE